MIRVIYISTGRLLVYANRVRQFVLRRKTTAKKNVSTRTIFTRDASFQNDSFYRQSDIRGVQKFASVKKRVLGT